MPHTGNAAKRGEPARTVPERKGPMEIRPDQIRSILATDCGSTTTKAILIEKREGTYRLIVRGEAPTTVEAPFEDVTRGVLNAVKEIEELAGRRILDGERIMTPQSGDEGTYAVSCTVTDSLSQSGEVTWQGFTVTAAP